MSYPINVIKLRTGETVIGGYAGKSETRSSGNGIVLVKPMEVFLNSEYRIAPYVPGVTIPEIEFDYDDILLHADQDSVDEILIKLYEEETGSSVALYG